MEFEEKIRAYFKDIGLTNRDVCKMMDNYSEPLYSRQLKAKEISPTLLLKFAKYFPDMDFNYMLKDTEHVLNKESLRYEKSPEKIIDLIEKNLKDLKRVVSRI